MILCIFFFLIRPFGTFVAARFNEFARGSPRIVPVHVFCERCHSHGFTGLQELGISYKLLITRGLGDGREKRAGQRSVERWRVLLKSTCGPLPCLSAANGNLRWIAESNAMAKNCRLEVREVQAE